MWLHPNVDCARNPGMVGGAIRGRSVWPNGDDTQPLAVGSVSGDNSLVATVSAVDGLEIM